MPLMISRRRLEAGEFDAWEVRFKGRAATRHAAGCRGVRYFRGLDDPDQVTIIFDWETREAGKAFIDAMLVQFPNLNRDAGVPGGSDYMFVEERQPLPN